MSSQFYSILSLFIAESSFFLNICNQNAIDRWEVGG